MKAIVLASTSIYRAELLKKLGLAFEAIKPNYDEDTAKLETLKKGLKPVELAELLSKGKGHSLITQSNLVISGDQLVNLNGEIIGKSKNFNTAFDQLKKVRGKTHELITAVSLSSSIEVRHLNHITQLTMKNLTDEEIRNYLLTDEPYDCAGSYKIEKSGIALFSKIICDDFTAIQGLPMLWLSNQLKEMGYEFFKR